MQPKSAIFAFFVLAIGAISGIMTACSGNDDVIVSRAWVRDAPPGAPMTAGYMAIENKSAADRVITKVESDDFEAAEIHVTRITDGTAKMRRIGQLKLPAGKRVLFEPGGPHLMLIKPKQNISAGDTVTVTLIFEDGKRLEVDLTVKQNASD
jgi:copper(I)-binding protein